MSLEEAAAALDRLLLGHSQGLVQGRGDPNSPPYAPPPPVQENILPTLLPGTVSSQGQVYSSGVEKPVEVDLPPVLLPWDTRTCSLFSDIHIPTTPLLASGPSKSWLPTLDDFGASLPDRQTPEDPHSQSSSSISSNSSSERGPDWTRAENFIPLDAEKYKTELCRSYQVHGYCKYGFRCNYAHGLHQLRGASHHGKYKTRNCQSYHQTGFCRYGARCSFIHDPEEGVLKCSIANKEVLEALHYCPASEDASRTANITWRLVESPCSPAQELHFITTTRPLEDDLSPILPPHSSSIPSLATLLLPVRGIPSAAPLSEADFPRCLPLQGDPKHNAWFQPAESIAGSISHAEPSLGALVGGNLPRVSNETSLLNHHFTRLEVISASTTEEYFFPQNSNRRQSLTDVEPTSEFSAPDQVAVIEDMIKECQDLQKLDVVHNILEAAPRYSATVWSDGTDPQGPIDGALNNPAQHSDFCQVDYNVFETSYDNIRSVAEENKNWLNSGDDGYDLSLCNEASLISNTDLIFSSTLRSDSEEEKEEEEGKITNNDSEQDDEWSLSSSLQLDELMRSLKIQEHRYRQLPWSKRASDSFLLSRPSRKQRALSPPSVKRRPHDLTKYKTELCRSFQYNGYCGYGEACLYAHGSLDLRSYPRHPMYRTKQCFSFHNKGFCLYGSRCQFLHDLE